MVTIATIGAAKNIKVALNPFHRRGLYKLCKMLHLIMLITIGNKK